MDKLIAGLLAPLMELAAAPTLADEGKGVTGAEAMAVLQAMDLEPELMSDRAGDPMIRFTLDGLVSYLNFYDCSGSYCGSLQLEVGLDLANGTTLQVANVYNATY